MLRLLNAQMRTPLNFVCLFFFKRCLPSGYLTVPHGKIHHAFKNVKPSISMGRPYHGYVTNNKRVYNHIWDDAD